MTKCWVMLGKHGDLLSALPAMQQEYRMTGETQTLMVSRDYAGIASGVPFIKPVIYDGGFHDLEGALKIAKRDFDTVVVPQIFGKDFPFQHRTPSFQLDQWERAGCLDQWDALPLDLPRPPNAKQIVAKHFNGKPVILFADHSQSSPFPHKNELATLLHDNFGKTHSIIRLSEIRMGNPLDLLPLYDAADLLVLIETMHLHLSRASKTPVVALTTERPSRWNGSAYQERFIYQCRYGEFPLRKGELLESIRSVLEKRQPLRVQKFHTEHPNGYNLSSIRWNGRTISTYRYHPEDTARTRLVLHDGEKTHPISIPTATKDFSYEDGRLFIHRGKLWLSYVVSMWPVNAVCISGYGELIEGPDGWRVARHLQPKYGRNDFGGLEKNFVYWEHDGQLFCIYGIVAGEQIVLQLDGERVVKVLKSPAPKWDYGTIRGGVVVPHNGQYLRFFHSRTEPTKRAESWRYSIGVSTIDAQPPFRTISVSKHPVISGNEKYIHGCKHWKQNVAIAYGCIDDGDKFLLSVGLNDCECAVVEIPKSRL